MQLVRNNSSESTSAASCSAVSQHASVWTSLQQGNLVTVTLNGYELHSGSVDDRTADGRTIWVTDRIGIDAFSTSMMMTSPQSHPRPTA